MPDRPVMPPALRCAPLTIALLAGCSDGVAEPPPIAAATAPVPSAPAAPASTNGCADGMARVGPFCVDRFEAHLVTRGPGGELAAHPYAERPAPGVRYEARSEPGVF